MDILQIKDINQLHEDERCILKATVVEKGEMKKTDSNKDFVELFLQDGDTQKDVIVMRAFKEESFSLVLGNSYLFQDVIKKEHDVLLTRQSKIARTRLPKFENLDVKQILKQMPVVRPNPSSTYSGRIVQVSPQKKTKGDMLQMARIKLKSGEVKKIVLWGHKLPNEGLVTITDTKASKLAEVSTSRKSQVIIHDEDDPAYPPVQESDIEVSKEFPIRQQAVLEAIEKIFSYKGCKLCRAKVVDSKCQKCGEPDDQAIDNFVAKLIMKDSANKLSTCTVFHGDIVRLFDTANYQDEVEDHFFAVIGQQLSFVLIDNVMSSIAIDINVNQ